MGENLVIQGNHLIIKFVITAIVVTFATLFFLRNIMFKTTDGVIQRLERDAEAARAREAELNKKIKEADEELKKRRGELDVLEKKMKTELEESATKQKEELLTKARQEAEEIITKAQNARDNIRKEIEKSMELKIIDYAAKIFNDILSEKSRAAFDLELLGDFTEKLKVVDMSRIGPEVHSAELITARGVEVQVQEQIGQVVAEKLKRRIQLNPRTDPKLIGGGALQFGGMLLDGSLQNFIRESATALKQDVDKKIG